MAEFRPATPLGSREGTVGDKVRGEATSEYEARGRGGSRVPLDSVPYAKAIVKPSPEGTVGEDQEHASLLDASLFGDVE